MIQEVDLSINSFFIQLPVSGFQLPGPPFQNAEYQAGIPPFRLLVTGTWQLATCTRTLLLNLKQPHMLT